MRHCKLNFFTFNWDGDIKFRNSNTHWMIFFCWWWCWTIEYDRNSSTIIYIITTVCNTNSFVIRFNRINMRISIIFCNCKCGCTCQNRNNNIFAWHNKCNNTISDWRFNCSSICWIEWIGCDCATFKVITRF